MTDLKRIILISFGVSIAITIITLFANGFDINRLSNIQFWIINFLYSFFLTYINIIYFGFINYKIQWKNKGIRRILIGAGGSIFVTMIGYFICEFVAGVVILKKISATEFINNQSFGDYIFPLLVTAVISLFFHTIFFYKALQEKKKIVFTCLYKPHRSERRYF